MKTFRILIPDMQSPHCRMLVNKAITFLGNAMVNNIDPGEVEVYLEPETEVSSVVDAIQKAGYHVTEVNPVVDKMETAQGQTYTFDTNINCSSCVNNVSSTLDHAAGICHWSVETTNPNKVLTVHSDGITKDEIIQLVESAGYRIKTTN